MHRRNATERYIRTWKNHVVSYLSGTDNLSPMHLWDRLLDQAQIMLSMLRPSRHNTKISAHAATKGNFDFNKTPLVPPSTNVIFHEKPIEGAHGDIMGYKAGT